MKPKFKVNDFVYTIVKSDGAIDIELKKIKEINNTVLGLTYDCLGFDKTIEVCFENNLYTLKELIEMEF